MKEYAIDKIRNVGVVGHGTAASTTAIRSPIIPRMK